jgi:predicted metal-binding membrane protein
MAMRAGHPGAAGSGRDRRSGERRLLLAAGLALLAASSAVTVTRSVPMPSMHGMAMADGAATGMRMPGGDGPGSAASFLGMWLPMMAAMMLPSLLPVLWRCHRAMARAGGMHPGRSTLLVGLGYFLAWTLAGLALHALDAAFAAIMMRLPVPPRAMASATGAIVLLAGLLQFTGWKARLLACCRAVPTQDAPLRDGAVAALGYGLRLGRHCIGCCAGATAVLFALGWMDLRVMAAVTAAITAERLMPGGIVAMRAVGGIAVVVGAILLAPA